MGPHKSISKKNDNKRKSYLRNKKFRSVSKPLYGIPADPNSKNGLKSPQNLLYKSKEKNKYPLMNTSTSISIVDWKITKKQLTIYQSLVVYHIANSITGSNRILTRQVYQIRIHNCYIVSSKDLYSYVKLLYQTYMLVYHTLSQECNCQPSITKKATCK